MDSQSQSQSRLNGTVKWFDFKKGYGFIKPDDQERDIFVHITAVQEAGIERLKDNQRISFEMVQDRNGKQSAGKLQLVDGAPQGGSKPASRPQTETVDA